jgi:ribosomal protein L40E
MSKAPAETDPHRNDLRGFLRFFGVLVVATGVAMTAIGAASLFSSWGKVGASRYFWAAFLGLPLIALGSVIARPGRLGPHVRNTYGEMIPLPGASQVGRGRPTAWPPIVVCHRCHASNAAGAKFCNQCGVSVQAETCPGCGTKIEAHARFCHQCGKSLG